MQHTRGWLIGVILSLCCASVGAAAVDSIGAVTDVRGEATVIRDGQPLSAENGFQVKARDVLRTGADGALGVVFKDETTLSLGPKSELAIDDYVFGPGTEPVFVRRERGARYRSLHVRADCQGLPRISPVRHSLGVNRHPWHPNGYSGGMKPGLDSHGPAAGGPSGLRAPKPERRRSRPSLIGPFWVGMLITLGICLLGVFKPAALQFLDYRVFDAFAAPAADAPMSALPVIVDIDERSLKSQGRWPWPRHKVADLVERIHAFGPLALGLDIMFPEPETPVDSEPGSGGDRRLARALTASKAVLGFQFQFETACEDGACLSTPCR